MNSGLVWTTYTNWLRLGTTHCESQWRTLTGSSKQHFTQNSSFWKTYTTLWMLVPTMAMQVIAWHVIVVTSLAHAIEITTILLEIVPSCFKGLGGIIHAIIQTLTATMLEYPESPEMTASSGTLSSGAMILSQESRWPSKKYKKLI